MQKHKKISQQRKIVTLSDRVPTGIPGLDVLMEGGLERNSITLIAGGAGTGKSIFSTQFLAYGALKFNEPGLYISFEEDKDKFFKHMKEFGWDLESLEEEKKFFFLESNPEQVKKLLDEGGGNIDTIIEKLDIKRVVIDSMTAFTLLFESELGKREASLALFRLIKKWNCTALIIGEFPGSIIEKREQATDDIEFEVDSIILVYYTVSGLVRNRALEILKMRGTRHARKIFPAMISPKYGFIVSPTKPVF